MEHYYLRYWFDILAMFDPQAVVQNFVSMLNWKISNFEISALTCRTNLARDAEKMDGWYISNAAGCGRAELTRRFGILY